MKKIIGMMILILAWMPLSFAADLSLIKEMETMRNTLPFKDAGRPALTRRLADFYFQAAVEADKDLILTGKGNAAEVANLRTKAAFFYRESLTGENNTFPAAQGELKIKIEFQLARLDRMSGKRAQALATFQSISTNPIAGKDLLRESLLTIAEMQDEDGKWQETQAAYTKALPLCQGSEATSYVRYRLAWAYFRQDEITRAQNEIAEVLFDGHGTLKDQVVADYIQFLAATPNTTGHDELVKIESLAGKTQRPQLLDNLADAFFAGGNRQAGVNSLLHAHRLNPRVLHAARLSEELYGFKRLDEMTAMLTYLGTAHAQMASLEAKQKETVDQILRRLVIQLDGQRKSNAGQFNAEVMLAIDTYLALFPTNEVTTKMRAGWLAANTDDNSKMTRLSQWIKADAGKPTEKDYRLERAGLAQKTKNNSALREEAQALQRLSKDESFQREWTYVEAKAVLDMGEEEYALGIFTKLAERTQNPDKWAIQSQHLALDILNRTKNYDQLASQAAKWTSVAALRNSAVKNDVAEMDKVRQEALFESATALGETPAALNRFVEFCLGGQFTEKSCANAKILAVKLQNQDQLVKVLNAQKDEASLKAEYERMGRFSEAAVLYEKELKPNDAEMVWLKTALLHQIGLNEESRTRVLRTFVKRMHTHKTMQPELQGAVISACLTSGLTNAELLKLPLDTERKSHLALMLENAGRGDAQTTKILQTAKTDMGPVWAKHVFDRTDALDQQQRKQSFYGKNSRANFERRIKLIGNYANEVKAILPNASTPVRIYLIDRVAAAYSDLDKEILATPMPAGLTTEQADGARVVMEELASPLRAEGAAYLKLRDEQMATLADSATWQQTLPQGRDAMLAMIQQSAAARKPSATNTLSVTERKELLDQLSVNPNNRLPLERLRDDFSARGENAAAAYFSGRLAEMEKI